MHPVQGPGCSNAFLTSVVILQTVHVSHTGLKYHITKTVQSQDSQHIYEILHIENRIVCKIE